jgi:hypothetical protein
MVCAYIPMSDLCSQETALKARTPRNSEVAFKTSRSLVLELVMEASGSYIVPTVQAIRYVSIHS